MEEKNNNPFKVENWKTYYINLDKRADRRKSIESELKKQGIPAERFSALTDKDSDKFPDLMLGRTSKFSYSSDKDKPPKDFVPGEWGCAFSHYAILKKHLDSGSSKILAIFEDDAHFCNDFKKRLEYLQDRFNLEWDFFYLGCFAKLLYDQKTNIEHVWKINDVAYGTHAMLVNPKSIPRILGLMEKYAPNVSEIDRLYIYMVPYVKMYCFVPGMVSQNDLVPGSIGGRTNHTGLHARIYGPHVFAENIGDFDPRQIWKARLYYRRYYYKIDYMIGQFGIFLKKNAPAVYKLIKSVPPFNSKK